MAVVNVSGGLGTATGKHFFLPEQFFQAHAKHPFVAQDKRITPIDVHYPRIEKDDVTYHLPPDIAVETPPQPGDVSWPEHAVLKVNAAVQENSVTVNRTAAFNFTILPAKDYGDLHDFFQKVATADQQQLVLTHAQAARGIDRGNWLRPSPSHPSWLPAFSRLLPAGLFNKNLPVPDWALQANKTHTPDYAKDASSVILYEEYVETVDGSGRATERHRKVLRILKPQGRKNDCDVDYDVDEKINYFRAWTIAADEKQYMAQDTDFAEVGDTSIPIMLSTHKMRVAVPPAIDVGATVVCESEETLAALSA